MPAIRYQQMTGSKHGKLAAIENQHCERWECHIRDQINAGDRGLAMTVSRHVALGKAPGGSPGDRQRREAQGARNVIARSDAAGLRPDAKIFSLMNMSVIGNRVQAFTHEVGSVIVR